MDQWNRTIFSSLSSNTFRTAVWHVAWYWVCWRMALEFHVVKNSSPWVLASGVGTWSGRARVNELVQIIGSNFLNLPSRDSWKHFDNIYMDIYIYDLYNEHPNISINIIILEICIIRIDLYEQNQYIDDPMIILETHPATSPPWLRWKATIEHRTHSKEEREAWTAAAVVANFVKGDLQLLFFGASAHLWKHLKTTANC